MKRIVTGILAHVDAGKTTLSEASPYTTGNVRKLGRVLDDGDAFLDTNTMEMQRGITIFTEPTGDHHHAEPHSPPSLDICSMSIFRRKWNEPLPCSTMRFWSFPVLMASKGMNIMAIAETLQRAHFHLHQVKWTLPQLTKRNCSIS